MPPFSSTSFGVFRVRDISQHYTEPTFDVVFQDERAGVLRCSETVWGSQHEAILQAERLEREQARPEHWEVIGSEASEQS